MGPEDDPRMDDPETATGGEQPPKSEDGTETPTQPLTENEG